ncbi:hypothetical protein D8674_013186 [Pyrus ussuriensis x Pyrus communis]|uniref:Uncharacterized protein n=1 Tax=Pyrus ussuriensis x Pyrus communis TaxID=2448454 RepID=A0A5N5GQ97_9ROSA|nr:hypothetical protein D8674_013186 [Pyrus ussuriensis x Pyrus communis]
MRKQFIVGLNPKLCTNTIINDGVTHETIFHTTQRVEQVNNRKKEKQATKGKQASSSGEQLSGFNNKFKAKNIKKALFIGGIKNKTAFKNRVSLLALLLAVNLTPLHLGPVRVTLAVGDSLGVDLQCLFSKGSYTSLYYCFTYHHGECLSNSDIFQYD